MKQDHDNYWQKQDSKIIFTHPRLTLIEDSVRLPDGTETQYLLFSGLRDYVTVIAERGGQLALVSDYAYPSNEWLTQFPEGDFEQGEGPEEAAARELAQEAGLSARVLKVIGMNYGHHRRTDQKNYIVLARDLTEIERPAGDKEEAGMTMNWFPLAEVRRMVRDGEIKQKNTLAALGLYWAKEQ